MKKPTITNENCRSPWTFDARIRQWEVVYRDERLTHGEDELYVIRVLLDGRDVFVTLEGEGDDRHGLSLTDLAHAQLVRRVVLSQRRFRWRWGWRLHVFIVIDEALVDVSQII